MILTAVAFAVFVISAAASASARTDKQLIFAINLPPSFLGEGAADIISDFDKVKKTVSQKTGYAFDVKVFASHENVIVALKQGNADIAWLPAYYYARFRATDKSGDVLPLVTLSANGSKKSVSCLYVRKDSGIKNLDRLISKEIAFPNQSSWVLLNLIFEDKNYPFPPYEFFSVHDEVTRESAALMLHFKKIDAVVLDQPYLPYIEKSVPGFRNEIYPLACTKPLTNTLLVYRRKIGAAKLAKVKQVLLGMHADPAMADAMRFMKMTGAQWAASSPAMYDDWLNIYSKAVKKGWISDYNKIERARSGKPD